MSRQLNLWSDNRRAPESDKRQPAAEKRVDPDQGIEAIHVAARSSGHHVFTDPDRQVAFDETPHTEWPNPKLDQNAISIDRLRNDIDGPAHRFVVKRHDHVEVALGGGEIDYGTVVDISHARNEVQVSFGEDEDDIWLPLEAIFPLAEVEPVRNSEAVDRTAETAHIQESQAVRSLVSRRLQNEMRYTSLKCISLVWTGSMKGRSQLSSPAESKAFFAQYWKENPANDQERFVVACLDTKNRVQSVVIVTIGTLDASLVHPREVFKPAVIEGSSSVVLSHNHPSGDTTPSEEDRAVTERLTKAGELLGITVLDHIIHGDGSNEVVSIREA